MENLSNLIFQIREKITNEEYLQMMNQLMVVHRQQQSFLSITKDCLFLDLKEEDINNSTSGIFLFPYVNENGFYEYPRFIFQGHVQGDNGAHVTAWECIDSLSFDELETIVGRSRNGTCFLNGVCHFTDLDLLMYCPQKAQCSAS